MSTPKRTFDREFKLTLVRQWVGGEKRLAQLCREHGLCQTVLQRWRKQYEERGENAWLAAPAPAAPDAEARVRELEAALGRAHLEIEFLRWAFEKKGLPLPKRSP